MYGGVGVRCRDLVSKIVEEASLNGVTSIEGMPVRSSKGTFLFAFRVETLC